MKTSWKIVGIVCGASGLALGGELFGGRKLREFCHLPNYAYQPIRTNNPTTTVSLAAIAGAEVLPMPLPPNGVADSKAPRLRVKQFQLTASELRVDHCAMTKLAVVLVEDGTWIVSGVAEQNPLSVPAREQPRYLELKRNGFHLRVRGVGLSTATDPPGTAVLGKPVYCELTLPCFWVERGQRLPRRWDQPRSGDIQRFFDLIERVEVDLSYE